MGILSMDINLIGRDNSWNQQEFKSVKSASIEGGIEARNAPENRKVNASYKENDGNSNGCDKVCFCSYDKNPTRFLSNLLILIWSLD